MKYTLVPLLLLGLQSSYAEERYTTSEGTYIIPDSNATWSLTQEPKTVHNNLILFQAFDKKKPPKTCETPASLACVYGLSKQVPGCPIKGTTALPSGGWGAIAVVEAYDNPYAEQDLKKFSEEFGLPLCTKANGCFSVVYTDNQRPPFNAASADEHVLDIEWAHAMAPQAKIIMVEAKNESLEEHMKAIRLASLQVAAAGGGLV